MSLREDDRTMYLATSWNKICRKDNVDDNVQTCKLIGSNMQYARGNCNIKSSKPPIELGGFHMKNRLEE